MNETPNAARVRLLVVKQIANVSPTTPASPELSVKAAALEDEIRLVEDLNFTSIDTYALFLALEETFQITIDDAKSANVKTVGDLYSLVDGVPG